MLRRTAVLLSALATAVLVLAVPAGAQSLNDSARGHASAQKYELDFTAVSTPHSDVGHVRVTVGATPESSIMAGPVTCLFVRDGYAVVVGEVTFTRGGDFVTAQSFLLAVQDGAGSAPDQFAVQTSAAPPPTQCKTSVLLTSTVTDGDIVVHDG